MDDTDGVVEFTFGRYRVLDPTLDGIKGLLASVEPADVALIQDLMQGDRAGLLAGDAEQMAQALQMGSRAVELMQGLLASCLEPIGDDAGAADTNGQVAKVRVSDVVKFVQEARESEAFAPLRGFLGNLVALGSRAEAQDES